MNESDKEPKRGLKLILKGIFLRIRRVDRIEFKQVNKKYPDGTEALKNNP